MNMKTDKNDYQTQMIFILALITLITFTGKREAFCQNTLAESASYSNLNDAGFVSEYKMSFEIKNYTSKDGSVLKEGSPLVIGAPKKNVEKKDDFPHDFVTTVTMIGKIKGYQAANREITGEKVWIVEMNTASYGISKKSPRYVSILATDKYF